MAQLKDGSTVGGKEIAKKEELDEHKADYVKHPAYAIANGSANAYSVTLNPAPTQYVEGMAIAVKINVDNTGASTINVNGLGAKAIKKPNGNDVSAGNLKAGSIYTLRYNGTNFILQGEGGSGNAQPNEVLSGKTFTNDNGEQTGTMPNRGAYNITPGTTNKTIPAGYHNGSGVVYGDADLVPENIKEGVNIFNVMGTLKSVLDLFNHDLNNLGNPNRLATDDGFVRYQGVNGSTDYVRRYDFDKAGNLLQTTDIYSTTQGVVGVIYTANEVHHMTQNNPSPSYIRDKNGTLLRTINSGLNSAWIEDVIWEHHALISHYNTNYYFRIYDRNGNMVLQIDQETSSGSKVSGSLIFFGIHKNAYMYLSDTGQVGFIYYNGSWEHVKVSHALGVDNGYEAQYLVNIMKALPKIMYK